MIQKTVFGTPFQTDAVTAAVEETEIIKHFQVSRQNGQTLFTCSLAPDDIVYGLGETMGPVNKRGGRYISFNTDTADHVDENPSLYSSHNFLIVDGREHFGAFFDTPGRVVFEIDHENSGQIRVLCETENLNLYQIENGSAYAITRDFLKAIGPAYIPPLWAFGYGQSRLGYKCEQDFKDVAAGHKNAGIPLDYICMDIDYMGGFADFTVNEKNFPDLKAFSEEMMSQGIHLVPIVDAGIKVKPGEPVYEDGVKKGIFCKNKEGRFFKAGVWPGMTHLPDFLNPKAREWFGQQYAFYTEKGFEGFWNDMNEPSIFYSEYTKGSKKLTFFLDMLFGKYRKESKARRLLLDYRSFFHEVDGKSVCHYDVHNVYGALMTRPPQRAFQSCWTAGFFCFPAPPTSAWGATAASGPATTAPAGNTCG